jgi:hypothetical protein
MSFSYFLNLPFAEYNDDRKRIALPNFCDRSHLTREKSVPTHPSIWNYKKVRVYVLVKLFYTNNWSSMTEV